MSRRSASSRAAGFTLIEAIMVIVITGIVAGMVTVFIKTAVDSYFDSVRRAELTDAADASLRQMMREIRLALPNSLRVKTDDPGSYYIEFIPTSAGGRYRDTGDGSTDSTPATPSDCDSNPTPADGPCVLDFTSTANTSFDVLGPMPALATGASGDYIVVYNLGEGYAPADAYQLNPCASPGCNIAQVESVSGSTVTLAANRFAAQTPPLPSPNSRFQVVPYATRAVTYACPKTTAGNVTRHWAYGINTAQAAPSGGSRAVVAGNATCVVNYTPAALQRNGLLYVKLIISDSGESIEVFQQVHVDNSP